MAVVFEGAPRLNIVPKSGCDLVVDIFNSEVVALQKILSVALRAIVAFMPDLSSKGRHAAELLSNITSFCGCLLLPQRIAKFVYACIKCNECRVAEAHFDGFIEGFKAVKRICDCVQSIFDGIGFVALCGRFDTVLKVSQWGNIFCLGGASLLDGAKTILEIIGYHISMSEGVAYRNEAKECYFTFKILRDIAYLASCVFFGVIFGGVVAPWLPYVALGCLAVGLLCTFVESFIKSFGDIKNDEMRSGQRFIEETARLVRAEVFEEMQEEASVGELRARTIAEKIENEVKGRLNAEVEAAKNAEREILEFDEVQGAMRLSSSFVGALCSGLSIQRVEEKIIEQFQQAELKSVQQEIAHGFSGLGGYNVVSALQQLTVQAVRDVLQEQTAGAGSSNDPTSGSGPLRASIVAQCIFTQNTQGLQEIMTLIFEQLNHKINEQADFPLSFRNIFASELNSSNLPLNTTFQISETMRAVVDKQSAESPVVELICQKIVEQIKAKFPTELSNFNEKGFMQLIKIKAEQIVQEKFKNPQVESVASVFDMSFIKEIIKEIKRQLKEQGNQEAIEGISLTVVELSLDGIEELAFQEKFLQPVARAVQLLLDPIVNEAIEQKFREINELLFSEKVQEVINKIEQKTVNLHRFLEWRKNQPSLAKARESKKYKVYVTRVMA